MTTKTEKKMSNTKNRAVVVIDRGWIYAGDVDETSRPGRIILSRAVWIFSWDSIGFAAMVENPKRKEVDLRAMTTLVDVPAGAEIYRIPVGDDWGL